MAAPKHEVFKAPENPDIPIWRYMDFTKFVSMLVNRGLFFSRLDKLNDPFEGSLPKLNVRDDLITVPPELAQDPEAAQKYRDSFKQVRHVIRRMRAWVFTSTWHMAEQESAAMWKLYARTEEAICVRSTFTKLSNLVPEDVFVGRVFYIDYDRQVVPFNNLLWPYIHKRRSFEHERELRAVIVDMKGAFSSPPSEPPPDGVWRGIDLAALIESVYVAPTAPVWFKDTVHATIKQFEFKFPVVRSTLDESPLW
jgi:hypothetical protein